MYSTELFSHLKDSYFLLQRFQSFFQRRFSTRLGSKMKTYNTLFSNDSALPLILNNLEHDMRKSPLLVQN